MAKTTVKNIFSHSQYGDVNYDNKEDCDWIIEAPPGRWTVFTIQCTWIYFNYTKEIHNILNNQLSFNFRKKCPSEFPHFRNGRWAGLWIRFHRNFLRIRWHWAFIWTILWQQDPAWNNISWRCFVIAVIFIDVKPLLIFQLPLFG